MKTVMWLIQTPDPKQDYALQVLCFHLLNFILKTQKFDEVAVVEKCQWFTMKTDLEAPKEAALVKVSRELQLSPVHSWWS